MQKILVTGITGLLGRAFGRALAASADFTFLGTGFRRSAPGVVQVDLRDRDSVAALLEADRPNFIVHAAAERRPDMCENEHDLTRSLNVEATRDLVAIADSIGARVLYLSTDYVFDGTSPPYHPNSEPHPLNFYGQTKLEGEDVVRAGSRHSVLRVPLLYGQIESLDESPVTILAKGLLERGEKRLDHWATRYPTLTDDVAITAVRLLSLQSNDTSLHGTFHFSGDEPMTKYDMAKTICEVWSLPHEELVPQTDEPAGAPRPKNSQLSCAELDELGISHRTPFRDAIAECLAPFRPTA